MLGIVDALLVSSVPVTELDRGGERSPTDKLFSKKVEGSNTPINMYLITVTTYVHFIN